MRLLFVAQQFRQGWGGAPESVRLMANQLRREGFVSDVFDNGLHHRDVGALALLPEAGTAVPRFDHARAGEYDAIILTGPWQKPGAIRKLLAAREARQKIFYLPRGGLGRAEFKRPRDIKKVPYFFLVERGFLKGADGVVFSSQAEARLTMPFARNLAEPHVIPDFVSHVESPPAASDGADGPVTLSFLAEISPRKGLLPLVEGFIAWSRANDGRDRARLRVGGAVRPGSERYLATVHAAADAAKGHAAIEFLGSVHHGDRDRFYTDTDLMVVSSSFESYGLTVIEALAHGCALLCCPDVGALEYLSPEQPVVTARGADAAAISEALAKAIPTARRTQAQRAGHRAGAAATIDAINERARQGWARLLHG
ncbi:MAG TPA: glycosyltransferase family 4 protein [Novosphingobium sp.]|nr:glycosyltransferase family 4 protein [Novosphingobium sp.]